MKYLDVVNGRQQQKTAIATSTGASDASKVVATRSDGLIDPSLFPTRRVGFIQTYTGTDGSGVGWIDEYDGKWVYLSLDTIRTIGNASSGAAIAQTWIQTLFIHLWDIYTAPIGTTPQEIRSTLQTSAGTTVARGTSGVADWNANRRLVLPDFRNRAIIGAGNSPTVSTIGSVFTKGNTLGSSTHVLTIDEIPSHNHTPPNGVWITQNSAQNLVGGGSSFAQANASLINAGGGQAHNNMQPSAIEHLLMSAGSR